MASELERPGHYDGSFVEIQGADGAVEARDCNATPIGEAIDPNGQRGWAHWDAESGGYLVETLSGLVLGVDEANLQLSEFKGSRQGGCDLVWPCLPMARVGASFAVKVAECLRRQGFCLIEMNNPGLSDQHVMHSLMLPRDQDGWSHPGSDFAEIYLGEDTSSMMMWMADTPEHLAFDGERMSRWYDPLVSLGSCLLPVTEPFLGFRASDYHGGAHLRKSMLTKDSLALTQSSGVTEDDVAAGLVECHLDFARRRRLCMMNAIICQEGIELWEKADPSHKRFRLELQHNRMLIFRHDVFGYRYSPVNGSELIVQAWMLEEPPQLDITSFAGSQRSLESILGGPTLNPERQVHLMNCNCRFPGGAYRIERDWAAYVKQTDAFIVIPVIRFDIDMYWEPAGQFNSTGKSSTRHAGLLFDNELLEFDNEFFGMSADYAGEMPPIQRCMMELVAEIFTMAAFNYRDSALSRTLCVNVADIGLEGDPLIGIHRNPDVWLKSCGMQMLSVNRLCQYFGLGGPAQQVDTACSASLVASNMGHAQLRTSDTIKHSLVTGLQHIMLPWPFIGLSGAGMLGSGGRCKTFDQSANGYNRGEGCGVIYCKVSQELDAIQERLACYCGSYVNQDGRSASLTAPNGPSQQMVIRGSLNQSDITPEMVAATENHGTGTALGDPIETGSIRAVFRRRGPDPLPTTSGKTHMGHLEAGAGTIGILKMVCQLTHGGVPANCHLRQPNAHCDFDGFPGLFPGEVFDLPREYHYGGCNGFGFGGTNSRCDFFAHRRTDNHKIVNGGRHVIMQNKVYGENITEKTKPLVPRLDKLDGVTVPCARCLGPMCWICGAVPVEGQRKHHCNDVREEAASYDYCSNCYTGSYLRGGPEKVAQEMAIGMDINAFLRGSWSGWSALDKMKRMPSSGVEAWEAEIVLGETRIEEFHLELHDKRLKQVVQPVAKRASQRIRADAPSEKEATPGVHWLIDGHLDGSPEGTLYKIRLEWGDTGLSVGWVPMGPVPDDWNGHRYRHRYFLVSSLSGWQPAIGTNAIKENKHLWKWFLGTIPPSGRAELLWVRDEDRSQMVYPAKHLPDEDSVPVCGLDDGGSGLRFVVWGKEGEPFKADLLVEDGHITVTLHTETMGRKVFTGSTDRRYQVVGTPTKQQPAPMTRDDERPEVWRFPFIMGEAGREEFQIWANENPNLRIYPAGGGAPGMDLACGPDRKGARKFWRVAGSPGALMEIVLDLLAEDHCHMVTCRCHEAQLSNGALPPA